MKVRTFHVKSMHKAIQSIKNTLGPDAVILLPNAYGPGTTGLVFWAGQFWKSWRRLKMTRRYRRQFHYLVKPIDWRYPALKVFHCPRKSRVSKKPCRAPWIRPSTGRARMHAPR